MDNPEARISASNMEGRPTNICVLNVGSLQSYAYSYEYWREAHNRNEHGLFLYANEFLCECSACQIEEVKLELS